MEKEADVTVLGLRPDQSHYISVARWAEKDTIECMVIIEWFGVSKFPSLFKKPYCMGCFVFDLTQDGILNGLGITFEKNPNLT